MMELYKPSNPTPAGPSQRASTLVRTIRNSSAINVEPPMIEVDLSACT